MPPAPPIDPRAYRVPAREWSYWTVVLPCLLMFAWTLLIGFAGLIASTTGSDGVVGADPGQAQAINAYEDGQAIAFLAAVALLITGAAVRPRWHRAVALTACGMILLDIGCVFLT